MSAAEPIRDAFRRQAAICARMDSPFTAGLCALLADRLASGTLIADRLLAWSGDPETTGEAVPLRLVGGLHALVLEGRDPALAAQYPPNATTPDRLWPVVAAALAAHPGFLDAYLDSPPQTNEVARSAPLAAGFLTVADATGLPLALSEIGASAGLNLLWDRYGYRFGTAAWGPADAPLTLAPDWQGPPPPLVPAAVVERAGCDRSPLDLRAPGAETRLLAYVWADQSARLARARAAADTFRAAGLAVERADAADWLADRLARPKPGCAHVVCHSVMWQYLPAATRTRIAGLVAAAGDAATPEAPVAWLRMEPEADQPDGATVTLDLWPTGRRRRLGRADYHGRWVAWSATA